MHMTNVQQINKLNVTFIHDLQYQDVNTMNSVKYNVFF